MRRDGFRMSFFSLTSGPGIRLNSLLYLSDFRQAFPILWLNVSLAPRFSRNSTAGHHSFGGRQPKHHSTGGADTHGKRTLGTREACRTRGSLLWPSDSYLPGKSRHSPNMLCYATFCRDTPFHCVPCCLPLRSTELYYE